VPGGSERGQSLTIPPKVEPLPPTPQIRRIRPAGRADLAHTARLHEDELPEGFFARIGWRFLRAYHAAFARSPQATVLVAEDEDGRPRGMLVGTLDNAAHYRWTMRRQGLRLVAAGLRGLVTRPPLAAEFIRTRVGRYGRAVARQLRPGGAPGGASPAAPAAPDASKPGAAAAKVAVLTHVAVAEDARGAGAGRRLVQGFVDRARSAGADEVRLITEADGHAARFYRSLGWRRRARRRASDGSEVEEYVQPL
jgi:ribosomal protein S18 acetylase RimI-like enzyme